MSGNVDSESSQICLTGDGAVGRVCFRITDGWCKLLSLLHIYWYLISWGKKFFWWTRNFVNKDSLGLSCDGLTFSLGTSQPLHGGVKLISVHPSRQTFRNPQVFLSSTGEPCAAQPKPIHLPRPSLCAAELIFNLFPAVCLSFVFSQQGVALGCRLLSRILG